VFAVNTNGAGFTTLHTFANAQRGTNTDGVGPSGSLILSGATLYGVASSGGIEGHGTVFAVNTDGSAFTNLHFFQATAIDSLGIQTNSGGAFPEAGLILAGSTLYGTAASGGAGGEGTIFALNTNGTGFTNLHSFASTAVNASVISTNGEGSSPHGLILSGNTLYGTASRGGTEGEGTVFALNIDGSGFKNLHSFAASKLSPSGYTNSDGSTPYAGLIRSGNILYGTTSRGSSEGQGTVFALRTDGAGFTNLHIFTAPILSPLGVYTNYDGATPIAGLTLVGNTLYGSASIGGAAGNGAVFALTTNGASFTTVHGFASGAAMPDLFFGNIYTNSEGTSPNAGLLLSGNTLYGAASQGGRSGSGTLFSLSFAPKLTISPSGSRFVLSWPTKVAGFNYTSFTLQTALAAGGVFADVPAATSPYTVTVTAEQEFFRLTRE
jgi:uncharacterized repeat protein (TIGR03803 family)